MMSCHAATPCQKLSNVSNFSMYRSHGTSEATPSKAWKEVLRQKSVLQMAQKNLPTFWGKHGTSWKLSKHFETSFGPSLASWKILSVGKFPTDVAWLAVVHTFEIAPRNVFSWRSPVYCSTKLLRRWLNRHWGDTSDKGVSLQGREWMPWDPEHPKRSLDHWKGLHFA